MPAPIQNRSVVDFVCWQNLIERKFPRLLLPAYFLCAPRNAGNAEVGPLFRRRMTLAREEQTEPIPSHIWDCVGFIGLPSSTAALARPFAKRSFDQYQIRVFGER